MHLLHLFELGGVCEAVLQEKLPHVLKGIPLLPHCAARHTETSQYKAVHVLRGIKFADKDVGGLQAITLRNDRVTGQSIGKRMHTSAMHQWALGLCERA